jgi:hypothetical protein
MAGWVVLSGQYLLYGYWDTAQRESFFDWFLLPALALQLVAQARYWTEAAPGRPRREAVLVAVTGALSSAPWFGKPTYAFFTFAQLAALLLDDDWARTPGPGLTRTGALKAFAAGCAAGVAGPILFLLLRGDARAYAHIQLFDVPAMYRFIWPRAAADIFSNPWCATQAIFALVGAAVFVALVALGEMPRRTLAVALAPLCALASVVTQAKGFPYHFHPVTACVHLQWLVFAAWVVDKTRVARKSLSALRLLPLAVAVAVALRVATSMEDSPYIRAVWLLWGGRTADDRATSEYFAQFPEPDFFPYEMRETAKYLRRYTAPDDRVQTYGMDPYVLFLAERESATPYIYAYDLNVDAALAGGTGGRPEEAQAERIRAIRDGHEADMLARLTARPPAAFVFFDAAPLLSERDAWADFEAHCRATAVWVRGKYRETARFGHDHVWLRSDIEAPPPDVPTPDTP